MILKICLQSSSTQPKLPSTMENVSPTMNFPSLTPDYEAKLCLNIIIHKANIKTYASKPDFENITPSTNSLSATA